MPNKNIIPLVLLGGGAVLFLVVAFMFLPSLNLAGSVVGGIGPTSLSLNQINLVTSTGLTTNTVWRGNLVYTGIQNSSLVGTNYQTPPTLLETLLGQRSRDQITVSSGVTQLSCNYPVSLAQDSNIQTKSYYAMNNLPVVVQPGTNNTDTSCAGALFFQQHNYNQGIAASDVCANSFINTCNSYGAKYIVSRTQQIWNGINLGPSPTLLCTQVIVDTSKSRYTVYEPTSFAPNVNIHYTISNGGTGSVENLDINPQNPVATSADRKVRVQLTGGSTAFNTQCPEYSGWYILLPNAYFAPQAIVVSRNAVSSLSTPVVNNGNDLSTVQSALINYNAGMDALSTGQQNYLDPANANYQNFRDLAYPLSGNNLNTNGQLMISRLNRPFIYPNAIVDMATDFAGIYEPQARPQIQSIVPNPVTLSQNGQQQKVDVYVANTGDSGAAITTTLSCSPSGVSVQGSTGGQAVSSSVPGDFAFYLAGNQGTYTCTARACDSQLQYCTTQSFAVNVRAQCNAGTKPGDNYGLLYNPDGSCTWQCNINSCPSGYTLNNCACIPNTPGSGCAAPNNLRSCETWNPVSCSTSVNPGYSIQAGMCVNTGGNQTNTTLSCQQQVNAIQCDPLDFFCPVNKTLGSFNCGVQSLVSVTNNLLLIVGVVCGSTVILGLFVLLGLTARSKGGKRR